MEGNLRIRKNAIGNVLRSDMHRWINRKKKMKEIRSDVKLINKKKAQTSVNTRKSWKIPSPYTKHARYYRCILATFAITLTNVFTTDFIYVISLLFYPVDSERNKENMVDGENDTYQMQSLHISSQGQESLLAGKKTIIFPIK